MSDHVLKVEYVSKAFGALQVLDKVSLEVGRSEIVGLLGPNGSGKSTLLNVLSGFYSTDSGRTVLCGVDLTAQPMHQRARQGLVRTFQLPSMPTRLTTWEVLLSGDVEYTDSISALWRSAAQRRKAEEARAKAEELLREFHLEAVRDLPASTLSGGQKKLLSMATVLMSQPRILCLDEPTAGVHPNLRREMVAMLKRCRAQGTAILVIEHDMGFIGDLCDRCVVLDRGEVIANCRPDELTKDARVVSAYLGRTDTRLEMAS